MSSYSFVVTDSKRVRVILDTDTACEADDPFAIAEALLSPKMIVKAIIAEHFLEEGSQQKSYEAIGRLTEAMELDPLTLHGEEGPLQEGAEISEGARFIVEEARRDDPLPLYVLGLGALSTIAAALREAPDIADRMTVVTIGGLPYEKDSPFAGFREFNFGNDVGAANLLLASAVPVWQIPMNVYTTMRIGLAEIELRIGRAGRPGKYLFDQMAAYNATPRAFWTPGESWSLGDSPAVGVVLTPVCGLFHMQKARHVNKDTTYSEERFEHEIRVYDSIDSRYILEDLIAKLTLNYKG